MVSVIIRETAPDRTWRGSVKTLLSAAGKINDATWAAPVHAACRLSSSAKLHFLLIALTEMLFKWLIPCLPHSVTTVLSVDGS